MTHLNETPSFDLMEMTSRRDICERYASVVWVVFRISGEVAIKNMIKVVGVHLK